MGLHALVEPKSVMMYSHDAFGLGHLRRNTTIAIRFVREVAASNVLMLVGCPSGAFFRLPPRVDFMKIPSVIKVDTGEWRPRALDTTVEKTQALRASTIQTAAELFKPQLFLVDYMPTGVWEELLPTLEMLKRREDPPKIVLGLRDILDAPEVTRALWRQSGVYEAIQRYYDAVFIYGSKEVFDTALQYGLNAEVAAKVKYCGYLCSEEPYRAKAEVWQDLRIQKDKLVVVTAGGGYDAYPMMQACMDALRLLGKDSPLEAIFITGPLMEDQQRESLRRQTPDLPVRVLNSVEDSLSYLNAADIVVTMAGYNTLMDAIRLQKRIVVVPRDGPSAEQKIRAEIFSRLRVMQAISPEQLAPSILARAIVENLDGDPAPWNSLSMNGLATVVRHMMGLLELDVEADPG